MDKKEKDIQDEVIVEPKSIINDKPLEFKLMQLRDLTRRWGVLDDMQITQLRLWPFAVDPSLYKNNVEVDFDKHLVSFNWLGEKTKKDKGYISRIKDLDEKVRFLLGGEWKIQILFNGKTIFVTEDAKPARKPAKPDRRRNLRKSSRASKPRRKR